MLGSLNLYAHTNKRISRIQSAQEVKPKVWSLKKMCFLSSLPVTDPSDIIGSLFVSLTVEDHEEDDGVSSLRSLKLLTSCPFGS